jgi:uncharacterized protein (TIGR02186 family)
VIPVLLLALLPLAVPPAPAAEAGPLVVTPDHLAVGLTYNGRDLHLSIRVPAGAGAAVRLAGPVSRVDLRRKGRVAGVLWMNVADVEMDPVPAFYFLATTGPLREMAPPRELAAWKLGYEALVPDESSGGPYRDQFVRLKQRDGLYRVTEGGLTGTGAAERGQAGLEGTLSLPARVPPGTWQVELFSFAEGRVARIGAVPLSIEYAGVIGLTHGLAKNHGTAYGWMAVLIALAVGLLTGILFGSMSQKGH